MPYIDIDFYLNEYYGAYEGDPSGFPRIAQKATDIIDALTNHQIPRYGGLDRYAPFIQRQVKLATAAQVEYFVAMGGWEEVVNSQLDSLGSVRLGNFNYGVSGDSTGNQNDLAKMTASMAKIHLAPTGLLYRGIGTRG